MSVVRAIEWQKARAAAEAILSRDQRAKIARVKAERALRAFDPDQPRDETGKWTSGGGDGGGAEAKPAAAPAPAALEGRLRGSNPSKERAQAWDKQIQAQLEALPQSEFGGNKESNLHRMAGALGNYARVKEGIVPSAGWGYNFIYTVPEAEEEPTLEAAVSTKYDAETKVARISDAGGVTGDALMAVLQDATIRCEGEGAKRVEANVWADDEETNKIYDDIGFERGGETAGIITRYRGEPTTPEEIETVKRREEERRAERANMITTQMRDVARDLDFDASKITLASNDDPDVNGVVNGREFKAAGVAYIKHRDPNVQGTIKLFPDQIWGEKAAQEVTAHEIKHVKFQQAIDRARSEGIALSNVLYGNVRDVERPDGSLLPEYAERYPAYNLMNSAFNKYVPSDFSKTDGVSNYSAEYWKQFENNESNTNYRMAMHETLAEMARAKYIEGAFPGHMATGSAAEKREGISRWRNLYRAVEKVYQLPAPA